MPAPSSQLTQLTNDTFWEFVRENRFAVVHFWAAWNGHDFMMRNLLESQIPKEVSELIALAQLDIDPHAHQEVCRLHNVLNVPFLALYRGGLLVRTVNGMRTPEAITEHFKDLVYGRTA